jgi:hypothetical protein
MDWGFFDHPPMVALIIKIGYSIFHNAFGVGLMTIILSFFTYAILWELVPNTNKTKNSDIIFTLIIFIMPISNIYGFVTTPDVPLLFFGTLYLLVFKQFVENSNITNAIKVGIVSALMLYSKYHGVLVIVLALIPYYKILFNRNFYLAGFIGFILFIPHLLWQYQHDFATFIYHINYRSDNEFLLKNIFEYILNTILILNPFISLILFYYMSTDKMNLKYKSLKFIFWGFILFFGYSSLKNHVEPHWIAMAMIPAILYLHNIMLSNKKMRRVLLVLIYISIPIIVTARIVLALPLHINSEFHKEGKDFYQAIADFAGDTNVIFTNSFSKPAKYTFYTGKEAFTTRTIYYHKTQYDFLDIANKYNHKPAYLIYFSNKKDTPHINEKIDSSLVYKYVDDFHVISNSTIKINLIDTIHNDSLLKINFTIYNPYDYNITFNDSISPYKIAIVKYAKKGKKYFFPLTNNLKTINAKDHITTTETFYPKGLNKNDQFGIAVSTNIFGYTLLSNKYLFKIGKY